MMACHLEPLLDRLRQGLAVVCEQAGEAVHHKFKWCKARYQSNKYHIMHGKAQRKAVVQWTSWNIHPRETVPSQTSDMGKKTLSVLAHSFLLP